MPPALTASRHPDTPPHTDQAYVSRLANPLTVALA